jgi:cation diffusion facilitator family transporter
MPSHDLNDWTHEHRFHAGNEAAELGTRRVMWITLATMVVEIAAGLIFNSMALLADGWHMSSHAVAIGVSTYAYRAARQLAGDSRFAFGTWKIEVLGGFSSALFLLGVGALMVWGSVERLLSPQPIAYREAIVVAALGLVVNIACALILQRAGGHDHHGQGHGHAHGHGHGHDHAHAHDVDHDLGPGGAAKGPEGEDPDRHRDLNLRSAYVHVLTDAATSVLAIAALAGGWRFGWSWLDPAMGLAGSALVVSWALGLIRETSAVLLDREMDHPVVDEIRAELQCPGDPFDTRITDLHVWRVGRRAYACAVTLLTEDPTLTPARVRERLAPHDEIVHATVEIHRR